MAKGGARARSGPPPDPAALRRDRPSDKDGWTDLPAEGRKGKTPAFPLDAPTKRELQLWAEEWKRPQAIEWERNGQFLEVALFVRTFAGAESPKATAAERTLVRQQMDALGISLPGLLRNRWRILPVEPVEKPTAPRAAPARRSTGTARQRLRAVNGGA